MQDKNIEEFFNLSINRQNGNKLFIDLFLTSKKTIKFIQNSFNFDVSNWFYSIGESDLRHIVNKHGDDEHEKKRGQRAITVDDFKFLPHVLSNPDKIELCKPEKENLSIMFIKDGIYCILEIRKGRKKLVVKTMWAKGKTASTV